jgi:hypothetical protein
MGPDLAKALAEKAVDLGLKESEKKQVTATVISDGERQAFGEKDRGSKP